MGFVMLLFFGWHVYLVLTNVTTNEKMKYSELESYMKHLAKYKQAQQDKLKKQATLDANTSASQATVPRNKNKLAPLQQDKSLTTEEKTQSTATTKTERRPPYKEYTGAWKDVNVYNRGALFNLMEVLSPFRHFKRDNKNIKQQPSHHKKQE
ncbi:hypothetical protein RFI_21392 [Reticulomyxa filosa]|uniref:Protein S-acyltransferase n=1 Tax=Reticulomyxa filosa TaxID=46433 RepID=X6MRB2_RETFI|nr:hypothetical protein RFI_21392 [Reticulomyxa filosa]|eukprot:ETO15967.1 hypothetical protein RFI_21392 [Reticulomyxa filosa]